MAYQRRFRFLFFALCALALWSVDIAHAKKPVDEARREACAAGWSAYKKVNSVKGRANKLAREAYMSDCEAGAIEPAKAQ